MNFTKLFAVASRGAYWPILAKGVLPTVEHRAPLADVAPATVIDVGANKGQFSAFAHHQWPNAHIHAFEPIPDQAARYERVMRNCGARPLNRTAMSSVYDQR